MLRMFFWYCVVKHFIKYLQDSKFGEHICGQQPKVGPIHRVATTKGELRTSDGKNGG